MLNGKCFNRYNHSTVATPKEMPQPRNHQLVSWARKNDHDHLKGPEAAMASFSMTCPPARKKLCRRARGTIFHIGF